MDFTQVALALYGWRLAHFDGAKNAVAIVYGELPPLPGIIDFATASRDAAVVTQYGGQSLHIVSAQQISFVRHTVVCATLGPHPCAEDALRALLRQGVSPYIGLGVFNIRDLDTVSITNPHIDAMRTVAAALGARAPLDGELASRMITCANMLLGAGPPVEAVHLSRLTTPPSSLLESLPSRLGARLVFAISAGSPMHLCQLELSKKGFLVQGRLSPKEVSRT
mmetsp:Transcript_25601/g.65065  ORF Transcript_25601/g.65065 Transcript_25601/m.65065 type:complete len:223 (+) Transcript_25601:146-814(+)